MVECIAAAVGLMEIYFRHLAKKKNLKKTNKKQKNISMIWQVAKKDLALMWEKKTWDIEAKKKRHLWAVIEHVVEFGKAQVSWSQGLVSETQSLPLPPLQDYWHFH